MRTRRIKNCDTCLVRWMSSSSGWCRLHLRKRTFTQREQWLDEPPRWCPLRRGGIMLRLARKEKP